MILNSVKCYDHTYVRYGFIRGKWRFVLKDLLFVAEFPASMTFDHLYNKGFLTFALVESLKGDTLMATVDIDGARKVLSHITDEESKKEYCISWLECLGNILEGQGARTAGEDDRAKRAEYLQNQADVIEFTTDDDGAKGEQNYDYCSLAGYFIEKHYKKDQIRNSQLK